MKIFDYFLIDSAFGDIFTHAVSFASYLSHQLFILVEEFVFRGIGSTLQKCVVFCQDVYCDSRGVHTSLLHASDLQSMSRLNNGSYLKYGDAFKRSACLGTANKKSRLGLCHLVISRLVLLPSRLKLIDEVVFGCFKTLEECVKRFICRMWRTFLGSCEDIGWLQQAPGLPPVVDGTSIFLKMLQEVRDGKHFLSNSFVYLLIPGLFSNLSPLYFMKTKRYFSKMGLTCHVAKIHSEASVEKNALELKHYIQELYWGSGKRILLLGHSKGGVDAAAALSLYGHELKTMVAGLALVQSPYGGTPVASDILREGQVADKESGKIMELMVCKLIKGDIHALEDLTYKKRKEFISKYSLPGWLSVVSFHTEADISLSVLATLSHIAHAEFPSFPFLSCWNRYDSADVRGVPVVVPLGAAMALCALHLKLRYGEQSDGLVTRKDAEVPGSVVVRLKQKLDHTWMVYTTNNIVGPNSSEMCEALFCLLVKRENILKLKYLNKYKL